MNCQISVSFCLLLIAIIQFASAGFGGYGSDDSGDHDSGLKHLGTFVGHHSLPPKIIKITKTIAVKVPVPYPVKVPHTIPYPVPVAKPYPVHVPKIIKIKEEVPVHTGGDSSSGGHDSSNYAIQITEAQGNGADGYLQQSLGGGYGVHSGVAATQFVGHIGSIGGGYANTGSGSSSGPDGHEAVVVTSLASQGGYGGSGSDIQSVGHSGGGYEYQQQGGHDSSGNTYTYQNTIGGGYGQSYGGSH